MLSATGRPFKIRLTLLCVYTRPSSGLALALWCSMSLSHYKICPSDHIHNHWSPAVPCCFCQSHLCRCACLAIITTFGEDNASPLSLVVSANDIYANASKALLAKEQLPWTWWSVPVISASCLARTRSWQAEVWNKLGQTCKPSWHLDILLFPMDRFYTCWSVQLLEHTSRAVSCPVAEYVAATMSNRKNIKPKNIKILCVLNHTYIFFGDGAVIKLTCMTRTRMCP